MAGLSPINSHFGNVSFQFSINPEKHLLIALLVLPGFAMAECHLPKAQEEFQGLVCAPGPCNQSVGCSVTTSSLYILVAAQVHVTNILGALTNLRTQKPECVCFKKLELIRALLAAVALVILSFLKVTT